MDIIFDVRKSKEISDFLKKGITKPVENIIQSASTLMRNEATKNLKKVVYNRAVTWKRTKDLLQSITIEKKSKLLHKVYVGMPYGIFVENGTNPHLIQPKKGKKFLAFLIGGKMIFARSVNHPGSKAYPFWKPAKITLSQKLPEIINKNIEDWKNKK